MQINKEFLRSLYPCVDRYKHFLKHNINFNGSFSQFLDLDTISYSDKVWVAGEVLNRNQSINWAILCAESVVPLFENQYSADKRVSNCINFLKTVKDFNNLTSDEKSEIKKHLDETHAITAGNKDTSLAAYYSARSAQNIAMIASRPHTHRHALYAAYAAIRATNAANTINYTIHAALAPQSAAHAPRLQTFTAKLDQEALNLQFLKQVCSS